MKSILQLLIILSFSISAQSQNCLFFDGINDRITGDPSALNSIEEGDFTLEAWIESDIVQESDFPMIFSNRLSEDDGMFFFFHRGDPIKGMGVQLNARNYFIENNGSAGDVLDGMRHHVAVTLSDAVLHFYIDGVMIGERSIFGGTPTTLGDGPLLIGRDTPTGNTFRGILSNIRAWNVARSLEQIVSTMNVELKGDVANLLLNYHLNEGEGLQVLDHSTGVFALFGDDDFDQFDYPTWVEDCNTFTAIDKIDNSQISFAYPNPTTNYFTIELDETYSNIDVVVYDSSGKILLTDLYNSTSIMELNTSAIPSGHYIIRVTTNKNISVVKMIVTR